MTRAWTGAALVLGAVAACNGEFRFDDSSSATAGTGGRAVASATGGSSSAGASGTAGTDDEANGCAHCEEFGLKCATEWQSCVECLANEDCSAALPYCDPALHRCSPCNTGGGCDDDCVCDGWSHACLQTCATESTPNDACSLGPSMCDPRRNVCVACLTDDDCKADPATPHCAPGGAQCAECASDQDCTSGFRCDQLTFTCVVCRDSRDCKLGALCDPSAHTCLSVDD